MAPERDKIRKRFTDEAFAYVGVCAGYSCFGWAFILLCICTVIGFPLAVFLLYERKKDKAIVKPARRMISLIEKDGHVCMSRVIMCNSASRSGALPVPALVLITFETELDNTNELDQIATKIATRGITLNSTEDQSFIRKLLSNVDYQLSRRRLLPSSLTRGREVYAVDIMLSPNFLIPNVGIEQHPGVPCVVTPGDTGVALHVPYWQVSEEDSETSSKQAQYLSTYLLAMARQLDAAKLSHSVI